MNKDDIKFKELSQDEVKGVLFTIRHIFTKYPPDKLKGILWDLYRGWIYESAEWAQPEDITNMLLFYEFTLTTIEELFKYSQYLERKE